MSDFDPTRHSSHPGKSRRHLPGLDGVRGLAILMVMIGHFITVGDNLPKNALGRLLHSGYTGVDLFFVLSGFLITGILIDSKDGPGFFRVFYIRRALRIFPLYYGLLAVSWLTVVFITPQDRQVLQGQDSMAWFWLYASNIGIAVKGDWLATPTWVGLGHFWSLAVEEQFYMVWPLLVFVLPVRWLKWLCAALVLASPLIFWVLMREWANFGGSRGGTAAVYVSTLSRLGVLAAGGWLAVVWREPGTWQRLSPILPIMAVWAGVLLLLERSVAPGLSFAEPSLVLLLGGASVGMAAAGTGGRICRQFFESATLRWLGKYSYGIYVYHHALKPVWVRLFWDGRLEGVAGGGWLATGCYMILATTVSLLLAWLSWKFFEMPILSLKSRFAYRPAATPGASPCATN